MYLDEKKFWIELLGRKQGEQHVARIERTRQYLRAHPATIEILVLRPVRMIFVEPIPAKASEPIIVAQEIYRRRRHFIAGAAQ